RAPFLVFAGTMGVSFLLIWRYLPQPSVQRLTGPLGFVGAVGRYVQILRRKNTLAAAVIFLLMFLGTSLYILYLPIWLEAARGATPGQVALLFFAGGVATAVAGPIAGTLSDRIGRKPMIVGASLGVSVVMAATTFVALDLRGLYLLFVTLMTLIAARVSPFQTLLSEIVPEQERGSLMSLMMAVGQLGAGIGAAVAGVVYSGYGFAGVTLVAAASVLLLTMLACNFLTEPVSP
ncbi:MAG: MFS transporter, partial [Gemmatimonadetes bacterium]|nr:MFS transporter [Gemmatimonadota bacterium]